MTDQISKPLAAPLTGKASLIVGSIGGLMLAAAAFIPGPYFNHIVGWVGFIGCVLAGLAVKPPAAVAGKPVLQGTALTIASGALATLSQFYALLPAGWPQGVALGVLGLLAWLSGVVLPNLTKSAPAVALCEYHGGPVPCAEPGCYFGHTGVVVDSKAKALDVFQGGVKGPPES